MSVRVCKPESEGEINFPDGTSAYVYSDLDYPTNHDNRISIVLAKGSWASGSWAVVLRGDQVADGKFHAWADRPNGTTVITFDKPTDNCTVTLPGTTPGIICVTSSVGVSVLRPSVTGSGPSASFRRLLCGLYVLPVLLPQSRRGTQRMPNKTRHYS